MKALKTYWGNLSGKRASAAKSAHETTKKKLPGAQQHEAKQVGIDAGQQQARLAKVTKEEAEWPRTKTIPPRPHKGERQLPGRKKKQSYERIARRKSKIEKQIAGGELIGQGAKDARANLGSVQSEIGAAGEAVKAAEKSRRTTRIATAVAGGGVAAAGGGYAYGKKKGHFGARLDQIELALDDRLTELSFARGIVKGFGGLVKKKKKLGLPPLPGQKGFKKPLAGPKGEVLPPPRAKPPVQGGFPKHPALSARLDQIELALDQRLTEFATPASVWQAGINAKPTIDLLLRGRIPKKGLAQYARGAKAKKLADLRKKSDEWRKYSRSGKGTANMKHDAKRKSKIFRDAAKWQKGSGRFSAGVTSG